MVAIDVAERPPQAALVAWHRNDLNVVGIGQ